MRCLNLSIDRLPAKIGSATLVARRDRTLLVAAQTEGQAMERRRAIQATILSFVAPVVFALGLLAAGQASTMTSTLAGQYVMEGFWKLSVAPWVRILFTRTLALGPAVAVSLGPLVTSQLISKS